MIFGVSAASFFRLVYGVDVCLFLCVFRLRAKTADMRNLQYLLHENEFFEDRRADGYPLDGLGPGLLQRHPPKPQEHAGQTA